MSKARQYLNQHFQQATFEEDQNNYILISETNPHHTSKSAVHALSVEEKLVGANPNIRSAKPQQLSRKR